MSKKGKSVASSGSGGAATAHGVEYQVRYATYLVLALMHEQLAAPLVRFRLTMEPRRVTSGKGTAWDICTEPDERLIEAKLQPTADDLRDWIARIKQRGVTGTKQFDLVYSNRGGRLHSLVRKIRIAKEASDSQHFSQLVSAEGLGDDFGVSQELGADAYKLLRRMHLVQCPEAFLSNDIRLHARFLVGAPHADRAIDFLTRKLTAAMVARTIWPIAELTDALRAEGLEVHTPPQLDHRGLDLLALQCLFALGLLKDPLPLQVLASAFNAPFEKIEATLRPVVEAKLASIVDNLIVIGPSIRSGFKVSDPAGAYGAVLDALLDYISNYKQSARQYVRSVSVLAQQCLLSRPKPVARSFQVIDKALKQLGDKHEVLKAASLSVEAARRTGDFSQRSREVVGWEAQALICGVSWVYQRIGRLSEARINAQKSLELGESIGWDRNTAFCEKCIGRLCRMEGEEEGDAASRNKKFDESIALLERSIRNFSAMSDFGPNSAEVGDCYSLMGRTLLSMGKTDDGQKCATKAYRLLRVDPSSKDYVDLVILLGDLEAAQNHFQDALTRYDEAITLSEDKETEITEMRARAFRQRAHVRARRGEDAAAIADFNVAADIWSRLGENESSASARWEAWLIANAPTTATRQLLEQERALVRVNAIEAHETSVQKHGKRAAARREDPGVEYWRRQIRLAKEKSAIEDIVW